MKENKVVIFGPWCGEFSYELSWWNPEIRKVKNDNFKNWHAVHVGFKGRRAMYKDFIDDYIPYPKELEETLKYPAAGGEHIITPGSKNIFGMKTPPMTQSGSNQMAQDFVMGGLGGGGQNIGKFWSQIRNWMK